MNREDIIKNNEKYGIKTVFYQDDQDILGYSLADTIYLNTNSVADLEQVSNHELFHFFEETEKFIETKDLLLNLLEKNDVLATLRDEYSLKYYGLYTEEEIKNGIIDTEIVIDLLTGISKHSTEFIRQLGEGILNQIAREVLEKRYLVLNLRKNVANMSDLSKWEKIFIENYYNQVNYDGLTPTLNGGNKQDQVRKDIQTELNKLYNLTPETFAINPDSKEVIRESESELKALETRGEKWIADKIKNDKRNATQALAKMLSTKIYEEYKHITDFIKGTKYEDAFKVLMLRETLIKTYKKDQGNILVGKRKLSATIKGHMVLNETTLDYLYNNIDNYDNFANLYYMAVTEFEQIISVKSEVSLDTVETYGKGRWLKFEGKRSNPEKYLSNAQELSALVQDTPWCTKDLASAQLEEGDFYVFVDNDNKPHIAIKLAGNKIDEVRGILNENAQELESDYRAVALSFLENNKDIEGGKEWYDKEEWNKRLVRYVEEIDSGTFKDEEVEPLLKDVFNHSDYKSHIIYDNSNLVKLKERLHLIKDKIARYYNCAENEVYTGDYRAVTEKVCPYKVILGNAKFSYSQTTDLGNLQIIYSDANFQESQITSLKYLKFIGGDTFFNDTKLNDLGDLILIGGDTNFNDILTSTGKIKQIGGSASFNSSAIINLGVLESIGGDVSFAYSNITNLGNLQNIGGTARFSESKVKSLGKLKNIGGEAYFNCKSIVDLGSLENVGGKAFFNGSSITNTGNLEHIGGDADFRYTKITSLGNILSVDGNIYLENSRIIDLGKLKNVKGKISFNNPELESIYNQWLINNKTPNSERKHL